MFAQFALLSLVVLLPDREDWTVPVALDRVGQVAAGGGLLVMVAAATSLGRGLTAAPLPNEHARLRTGGLYRWVRHPIYAGLLFFALARTLPSGNAWTAAACVLLVALINGKARWEERRLADRFPDYPDYARRTPRFIPGWP